MLAQVIIFILVLIIFSSLIMIIRDKPDLSFWILLNMYFDPGGYFSFFLSGKLVGPFTISDVSLFLIIFCLFVIKTPGSFIRSNRLFYKFIIALFIYSIYYFFVYGFLSPLIHDDLNYFTFLLKNRGFIYGVILLISVYYFSLRSLKYFYYTTLFFGVVCLSLYSISLITGLNILPVNKIERYAGSGIMRISMGGYGLFDLLFPLAIIINFISRRIAYKIRFKKWLFYAGIFMATTLMLTLTRRTLLSIPATILIIIFIVSYLYRSNKLGILLKITVPSIIIMIILSFTFQKYIGYIATVTRDTFQLIITGKDTRDVSDYRVSGTGDLMDVKDYIAKNLWIGSGWAFTDYDEIGRNKSNRGSKFANMVDAATEVPIYYLFFGFGLFGAILILRLYYIIFLLMYRLFRILKIRIDYGYSDSLMIMFSIYILFTFFLKYSVNIYSLGIDFTGFGLSLFSVSMGIGFALYYKLLQVPGITDNKEKMKII
jgi:hypothetical protein